MGETAKSLDKSSKGGWFKGLKAEFKKIIWSDKETVAKETAAVVVVSVVLGIVISLLDMAIKYGIKFLV